MEPAYRVKVLEETLEEWMSQNMRLREVAQSNLASWKAKSSPPTRSTVEVLPGDWGDVTLSLTQRYGEIFAVLNMANAVVPGGGYMSGCVAQEENMFRRTDCHFSLFSSPQKWAVNPYFTPPTPGDLAEGILWNGNNFMYTEDLSSLINGAKGTVFLDTATPRVCFKGSEVVNDVSRSYQFLRDDQVFLFYEMRSAAVDLRRLGSVFDEAEMRKRICAQLNTLITSGIRHVVFGAFGCGAFKNPTIEVARIYREEIQRLEGDSEFPFDVIAFAIYDAGYGPAKNFEIFEKELSALRHWNHYESK